MSAAESSAWHARGRPPDPGRTICLLESHPRFGTETSTHNSGVIHAGIYYPAGSLKGRLCVDGRDRLYRFCTAHDVPYRRCGKLIVDGPADDATGLEVLLARGLANGVDDLEIVDRHFVHDREPPPWRPGPRCGSPSTGIVEAEALVRALHRDAAGRDAIMLPAMPLVGADATADRLELRTPAETIRARAVVNAAGLWADDVSAMLGGRGLPDSSLSRRVRRVDRPEPSARQPPEPVYPLPPVGEHLGVHVTPTTWGSLLVGPTTRYQDAKDDHEGHRVPVEAFVEPTRLLLPSVAPGDLRLGGTGIRPKLSPDETTFSDFLIERDPAQPCLIQVAGIDSPGLTACLSIARQVSRLVDDVLR